MLEHLQSDKFLRYPPFTGSSMFLQVHPHVELDGHPRA